MTHFSLLADRTDAGLPIEVAEIRDPDSPLISALLDIDLMTHSEPRLSRHAATELISEGRVFLLRVGDLPCGVCCLLRSWSRPDEANLTYLAIRPGFRGQLLGQHFLQELLDRLRREGVRAVSARVRREGPNGRLLWRCGFTPDAGGGRMRRLLAAPETAEALASSG